MLLDAVVNYAIEGIRNTFKVDGLELVEKTVNEKKLKLKFDRMGMKLTVEFLDSELASIVYYNFLEDEVRDDIMEYEFVERFKEYLAVCRPLKVGEVEKFVTQMCNDIRSGKLFKGNGQVMKPQEEPQEEKEEQDNSTKELGYEAPAQLGYEGQEEPQEEIQEAEIVEDDTIIEDEEEEKEIF